jgi:hypothetical protein
MLKLINILRRQRGQVALEAIIVFPIWLVVTTLFINLMLFLGSAMIVQSNVDRAALQAGAFGCVSPQITNQLAHINGFGVELGSVQVYARTLAQHPPQPGDDNTTYYQFHRSDFVDTHGNALPPDGIIDNADCPSGLYDTVPSGGWIWIQVSYTQRLWVFGTRTVHQEALVVSHNLQGG